jgi:hypothetical protein
MWRDPIPSQNRESGVGGAKESSLEKKKPPIREIAKSRNDQSRPFQRTGGSRSSHRRISISAFRVSSCQRNLTSQLAKSRYSDKISVIHLSRHVANIVALIGISAFGVSSCQRNLTSQLAKSQYVISRSDLSCPYLLDTWRTSRAPSAYQHSEF